MITIRRTTAADVPLGLRLVRQAKWNQRAEDWRRFMAMQPDGCFVAELDGTPVGTTTTCIFGPVAWVAMVLVDVEARRRGVATTLMKHALDFLDRKGVKTVRLDATAAGRPVYERLGFVPEYELTRYEGVVTRAAAAPRTLRATANLFAGIIAFDHRMTGTPRGKMLARLFEESTDGVYVLCRDDRLEGYITERCGFRAGQIGPCVAVADAGAALLNDALGRAAGRAVFLDIPRDNAAAVKIVEAGGLGPQRHFVRMCRGDRIDECPQAIWVSSGPEKG